ncbi:MAG: hypothetical protein ACMUHM_03505, partial [Thermoplasmatota archaeon]
MGYLFVASADDATPSIVKRNDILPFIVILSITAAWLVGSVIGLHAWILFLFWIGWDSLLFL